MPNSAAPAASSPTPPAAQEPSTTSQGHTLAADQTTDPIGARNVKSEQIAPPPKPADQFPTFEGVSAPLACLPSGFGLTARSLIPIARPASSAFWCTLLVQSYQYIASVRPGLAFCQSVLLPELIFAFNLIFIRELLSARRDSYRLSPSLNRLFDDLNAIIPEEIAIPPILFSVIRCLSPCVLPMTEQLVYYDLALPTIHSDGVFAHPYASLYVSPNLLIAQIMNLRRKTEINVDLATGTTNEPVSCYARTYRRFIPGIAGTDFHPTLKDGSTAMCASSTPPTLIASSDLTSWSNILYLNESAWLRHIFESWNHFIRAFPTSKPASAIRAATGYQGILATTHIASLPSNAIQGATAVLNCHPHHRAYVTAPTALSDLVAADVMMSQLSVIHSTYTCAPPCTVDPDNKARRLSVVGLTPLQPSATHSILSDPIPASDPSLAADYYATASTDPLVQLSRWISQLVDPPRAF